MLLTVWKSIATLSVGLSGYTTAKWIALVNTRAAIQAETALIDEQSWKVRQKTIDVENSCGTPQIAQLEFDHCVSKLPTEGLKLLAYNIGQKPIDESAERHSHTGLGHLNSLP